MPPIKFSLKTHTRKHWKSLSPKKISDIDPYNIGTVHTVALAFSTGVRFPCCSAPALRCILVSSIFVLHLCGVFYHKRSRVLLHCTRICMANNGCCTKISTQCKSSGSSPLRILHRGQYSSGSSPSKPPIICHISSTKSMANYIFMRQLCHLSISNRFVNTLLNTFSFFSQYIFSNQCSHLVEYIYKVRKTDDKREIIFFD